MEGFTSSSSPGHSPGSTRYKISVACVNCKSRKCKCSGGTPCDVCNRLGLECMYDAALDRRRKVYLDRTRTESALQKELLQRLLDLVRFGGDDIQRTLTDDPNIISLAQRLGVAPPTPTTSSSYSDKPHSWALSHAWQPSLDDLADDVGQREELIRRRSIRMPRDGSNVSGQEFFIDSEEQPNAAMRPFISSSSSGTVGQSSTTFDPKNQYRIFCPGDHDVPEINTIHVFGDLPSSFAHQVEAHGPKRGNQQMIDVHLPEYLIQPLLFDEERCPMAAVYTEFRDYGRRQLVAGVPLEVVLGPPEVGLDLFFRKRRAEDPHTPATWACEYLRLLKDLDVYVSLACIFTYARFMRWAIAPSAETYVLLPDAMRPTPLQRLVPHHPGCDLPIFPEMRDGLIHDMRDYIVAAQTLGYTVNWEYGLDVAIDTNPVTGSMTISEAFAEHVCDLANWSISQSFAAVFPELRGHYVVDEVEIIAISEVNVAEFLSGQR